MPEVHPKSSPREPLMRILAHIAQAELLSRRQLCEPTSVENREALRRLIGRLRSIRTLIRYLDDEVMI